MPQLLEIAGLSGTSRRKKKGRRPRGLGVTTSQVNYQAIPGAGGSNLTLPGGFRGLASTSTKKLLTDARRLWSRGGYMGAYVHASAALRKARGLDREKAQILVNRCVKGGLEGLI